MIDLHLHTTASDGRSSARELLDHVAAGGVTTIAVTDHDTTAAVTEVQMHALPRSIEVVTGIEVTAVTDGRDIHVLGYFIRPADERLDRFLSEQRATRIERVEAAAQRLAELGMPVDVEPLLIEARRNAGRSIGRPQVARAMIEAGHVSDMREAFDRWLSPNCPAYIPRAGATPERVIEVLHEAGGLASLAHPGRTLIDERISALRDAGLDAIEVFHPHHDAARIEQYRRVAADLGLLITGGSDFHGDLRHGMPGFSTLPVEQWEQVSAARDRHA